MSGQKGSGFSVISWRLSVISYRFTVYCVLCYLYKSNVGVGFIRPVFFSSFINGFNESNLYIYIDRRDACPALCAIYHRVFTPQSWFSWRDTQYSIRDTNYYSLTTNASRIYSLYFFTIYYIYTRLIGQSVNYFTSSPPPA